MSHDEIVAGIQRADLFLRGLGIVAGVLLTLTLLFTAYVSWSTSRTLIEQADVRAQERVVAQEDVERRSVAAQEDADRRLGTAMECLTGLLLVSPGERTDEVVHRVCAPELIDGVRERLAP